MEQLEKIIELELVELQGRSVRRYAVKTVACAKYSGRDRVRVRRQLEKMRKKGHAVDDENPSICLVSRYLLTTEDEIEVQGIRTSGEVEVVALVSENEILVGVGSDHDDRALEREYTDKPKQLCPKIMSPIVWRFEEVKDHWDDLVLSAEVTFMGKRVPYQRAPLSVLVTLDDLFKIDHIKGDGLVLFCGTVPLLTLETLFTQDFYMRLEDPILNRSVDHHYVVRPLSNKP